jgi:aminobenzoyl-glutamate utilization protein A
VDYKAECAGATQGGESSPEMTEMARTVAQEMGYFENILGVTSFGATEDFSHLLTNVQKRGGKGTYVQLGADISAGHHHSCFDFDEKVIAYFSEFMARVACRLLPAKGFIA